MRHQTMYKSIFIFLSIMYSLLAFSYTTPQQFMNLYFDFTGSQEQDYPSGKQNISQMLIQSESKQNELAKTNGPLVMVLDSSIYVYDTNRNLMFSKLLRTNRHTGFYELTAISHIGPALAYLAKIKENGDEQWKPAMETLLKDIRAVKALNAQKKDNWLSQANIPAWTTYNKQIQDMVDYATSMSGNYIVDVLNGEPFSLLDLDRDFLSLKNNDYPIPFNAVMVGTFMLTALQSMNEVYMGMKDIDIDWPNAMVIVRNVAGGNVTAGVTRGTNWMVKLINALSKGQLPNDRIFIAPYAKVTPNVGKNPLPEKEYSYYRDGVWASTYNRTTTAKQVFTNLTSLYIAGRPAIPGDYNYSKSADIMDFLVRLKFSLANATEMLSNSVGFWMAGELEDKNWDVSKVLIPGFNAGLPQGVKAYPSNNPEIGSVKASND